VDFAFCSISGETTPDFTLPSHLSVPRGKPHQRQSRNADGEAPLQGWKDIAAFLAQPVSTAQRWAKSGMPVRREGRYTTADREELSRWLGRESHMPAPARIATNQTDLATGLKESIKAAHRRRKH